MFINSAQAQEVVQTASNALQGGMSDGMRLLVQFGLIILIFYFLLLRPQQKKMKAQMQMLESIKKGDKVVVSGLVGKVVEILNDKEVMVEFSKDNTVKVVRGYVSQVLTDDSSKKEGK
ncbi:MAG: preprotein translocase subunit YajC [Alphaproteobacteria bacterium]|nr:preprotein translocase subunit YajC [Alphaproteobacteria bacterium]NCB49185.1 preprotein translocase subunit YajC [Alphaproteobacteria bacterium]